MADREYPSIGAEFAEQFAVEVDDGVTIAAYELTNAQSDTPVLLWGHANGFSAGSYLPLLRHLVNGGLRVFSYDVRGQGGSSTPPEPFAETITFDRFARDLEQVATAVLSRAPGTPIYFAGHSFSAAAMYYLGGGLGFAPWRAVTTFDATLRPSDHQDTMTAYYAKRPSMSHRALRRRRFLIAAMLTSKPWAAPTPTGLLHGICWNRIAARPCGPVRTAQKDGTQLSAGSRSGNL